MRRLLLATALAAVVATTGAACGGDNDTPNAGGGTTSPTPAASATSGGTASDQEVCASVKKTSQDFTTEVTTVVTQLHAAGSDLTKVQAGLTAMQTAFNNYVTAVRADAAKASNPELKSNLETLATAIDGAAKQLSDPAAIAKDPTKIMSAMTAPEVEAAGTALQRICGP